MAGAEVATRTGNGGKSAAPRYVLRLFVAGNTSRSLRAVENLKRICETHLYDDYDLEVIDIYQFPAMAAPAQVFAAPTLLKELPLPLRRIIGDMGDTASVMSTLGLPVPSTELN